MKIITLAVILALLSVSVAWANISQGSWCESIYCAPIEVKK